MIRQRLFPIRIIYLPILVGMLMIFLPACRNKGGVIPEGDMIDLLADMQLAEALSQNYSSEILPDSIRKNLGERVLAEHGYTYAELDTTLAWYGRNIDKYYDLFEKVDKRLNEKQKKIAKASGTEVNPEEDSANDVWRYADFLMFSKKGASDGLQFSYPLSSLQKGESLELNMRFSTVTDVKGMIGVEYTDGTKSLVANSNMGNRKLKLTLITDTSRMVKRVFGTVNIDKNAMPIWADSISLRKLPFDSTQYYRFNSQRFYRK